MPPAPHRGEIDCSWGTANNPDGYPRLARSGREYRATLETHAEGWVHGSFKASSNRLQVGRIIRRGGRLAAGRRRP